MTAQDSTNTAGANDAGTTSTTPPATAGEGTTNTAGADEGALGEAGKKALDAERSARKAAEKAANDALARVKEFEDRDKTETQKLQEERDALKAENSRLAIETLRRDVAISKGITPEAASRLVGTTREELEADADVLLGVLKAQKPAFGNATATSTSSPAGRIYKKSELNDHAFYTAHKPDILAAYQEGRITED